MNSEILGSWIGAVEEAPAAGAVPPSDSSTAWAGDPSAHGRTRQQARTRGLSPSAREPRLFAISVATDPPEGPEDGLRQDRQIPPDRMIAYIGHVFEYPVVEG